MHPHDAEKIAFKTLMGNFYYTIMPFGIWNAGITNHRAMVPTFFGMLHDCIKNYIDDHVDDMRNVFKRCTHYKLRRNSLKSVSDVYFKILWNSQYTEKELISIQSKLKLSSYGSPYNL